jgi:hypothetical protein
MQATTGVWFGLLDGHLKIKNLLFPFMISFLFQ